MKGIRLVTAGVGVSPQLRSNIQRTPKSQSPINQQAAHLESTTILKGWESISPGLRGTSYPGSAITKTNFTLKRVISTRVPIGGTDQMCPQHASWVRFDAWILMLLWMWDVGAGLTPTADTNPLL